MMTTQHGVGQGDGDGKPSSRAVIGWCLYDWANSAFPTLISTFVFATYFTQAVAPDPIRGTELWGYALSVVGLLVAVLAPVLGAVADSGSRRKPWLMTFTLLLAMGCGALWWVRPDPAYVVAGLLIAGVAHIAFELGMVFYNTMLADFAPRRMVGRISGWGWGVGYLGGLTVLALSLVTLVSPEQPWFGVSKDDAGHIRAVPVLAGIWILLFSLPLFVWTPDRAPTPGTAAPGVVAHAIRTGLAALWHTLRHIRTYPGMARFLVARMLYTDGLNTLFAFGGIFAAAAFGMETDEILLFGIALNVTAGLGAILFAFLDDRWGPKRVIMISVGAITVAGAGMLLVTDKTHFWALGLLLGVFLGPAQAASRSLMTHLTPANLRAEFFGLYALSGKITAFAGPLLLAIVAGALDSQRAGMATVLIFTLSGMALLWGLKPPPRATDKP